MTQPVKYTVFQTAWGFFGLASTDKGLLRTHLPHPDRDRLLGRLLLGLENPQNDRQLFHSLQKDITAYFSGHYVEFNKDIPIDLATFSTFSTNVYTACRTITIGRTKTYAELAKKAGRPKATRAVGTVMAGNPLPLIIPCHRIIRSDGSLGGFFAPGGTKTKAKLLNHEQSILNNQSP